MIIQHFVFIFHTELLNGSGVQLTNSWLVWLDGKFLVKMLICSTGHLPLFVGLNGTMQHVSQTFTLMHTDDSVHQC